MTTISGIIMLLLLTSTHVYLFYYNSKGGHGAWVISVNNPDLFSCVLSAAAWIRKEEYSGGNAFFDLDISNSYVDPELKLLLEQSMSEFHVDKLISNLQFANTHIRVGSDDSTTHPWFSRRMYRLLKQYGYNVEIEELKGKQHWWWDTIKTNDGGVVNDSKMRSYYKQCSNKYNDFYNSQKNFINFINKTLQLDDVIDIYTNWLINQTAVNNNTNVGRKNKKLFDNKINKAINNNDKDNSNNDNNNEFYMKQRCNSNISFVVINPSSHSGLCGIKVLQQINIMQRSNMKIICSSHLVNNSRNCNISTGNVKKFSIQFGFNSILFGTKKVLVNNKELILNNNDHILLNKNINPENFLKSNDEIILDRNINNITNFFKIEICISGNNNNEWNISICKTPINYFNERSLINYGPFRNLYNREFFIVYGTPSNQLLRVSMKDLAIYIANSHFISHDTKVIVLSDLEYKLGNYMKAIKLANILFIGGSTTNKLLKMLLNANMESIPLNAKLPGNISIHNDKKTNMNYFSINNYEFSSSQDAIIFTLPIYRLEAIESISDKSKNRNKIKNTRKIESAIAMGGCIHANSAAGYQHITRLAWPVVPPMVRSAFANYIPDFMVINNKIWSHGFGQVQMAGYWGNDWKINKETTYINFFRDE